MAAADEEQLLKQPETFTEAFPDENLWAKLADLRSRNILLDVQIKVNLQHWHNFFLHRWRVVK